MPRAAILRRPSKKTSQAAAPRRGPKAARAARIDFSALPSEAVTRLEKVICLACVLEVFTRHMGLAVKTAQLEIKRYKPSLSELNNPAMARPYFAAQSPPGRCPYCGSPAKWHARLLTYRIEGSRTTDVLRRELVKGLRVAGEQFVTLEERGTRQGAFFEWLEKMSESLNADDPGWLRLISLHYLSRKEPKEHWESRFHEIESFRRARRLESGWEVDQGRLYLAPVLFDELLLVQYLVSRSQKAGGLTWEGRYTLPELIARLRTGGYLRAIGLSAQNPSDAFEQILDHLSGGQSSMKFYYIVDRRDLLEKLRQLRTLRIPKPVARV